MPRSNIPPGIRWKVFARDGFRCRYCGAMAGDVVLVIDHQHPVALGGRNNFDNLITACEECNQGKSDSETPTFPDMHAYHRAASIAAGWLHMEWCRLFRPFDKRMDVTKAALLLVVRDSISYYDALDTLETVAAKCREGYYGAEPWANPDCTLSQALIGYADWKIGWMAVESPADPTEDDYAAYVARYWEETPY